MNRFVEEQEEQAGEEIKGLISGVARFRASIDKGDFCGFPENDARLLLRSMESILERHGVIVRPS